MVDMGTYEFNDLNTGENTREESFTNTYTEKKNELEHVRTSNKRLCVVLDDKYDISY